jgi:hypothetical protein
MEVRDGTLTAPAALTYFTPFRAESPARAKGCWTNSEREAVR